MTSKTVYFGTFVHSKSLTEFEALENTAVGVDEKGVIAFVVKDPVWQDGKVSGHADYERVVALKKTGRARFFFPGFIDTHIHASQFQNAGIFGKTTLLDWLRKYTFPTEVSFSNTQKAELVYTHCIRHTLSHGTTTAAYYTTIHVESTRRMAELCQSLGQRAFVGRVCMEAETNEDYYRDASVESMLADTNEVTRLIRAMDPDGSLVNPIITPRSALQCTEAGLQGLGTMQKSSGILVQTHVSENRREIDMVKEAFPTHRGYVHLYDDCGLLGEKTVLAHAIHLAGDEMQLMKDRGTKISHCPVSNTCIASGLAPVREMLDLGLDVGLGTDISGGCSPSILAAAREASGVSRLRATIAEGDGAGQQDSDRLKLSVEECLYLATLGGAHVLSIADKVGAFHVGKAWDAQLVDLGPDMALNAADGSVSGGKGNVALWGGEGWEEIMAKWLFCGDDRNTDAVWVAGRLVSGQVDEA